MAKNKYPHFDPSKHNVDVKMAKVRVSSHMKCQICRTKLDKNYVMLTGKNKCNACLTKKEETPEEKKLIKRRRKSALLILICFTVGMILVILGWILVYLNKIGMF